jgi:hypothetical protein
MVKKTNKPEIYEKVLNVAMRNLRQVGCAFKIMDADGNVYDYDVERLSEKQRSSNQYEYGAVRATYIDHIRSLEVGQVASVPFDTEIPPVATQSGACAWMSQTWGAGTYTTHINRDKSVIEILRLE